MPVGLSQRAVLRTGYIAVIAVLVLSAFEAWRIQNNLSAQNLIIYRHYAEQDKALRVLRLNLWQAGNYVRDFLIVSTPAQAALLHNQLDDLKAEDDRALQSLDREAGRGAAIPKLRRSLGEFWNVANAVPDSMLNVSDQAKFQFLQREIVPRRGELYNAMLDLAAADQQKLEEGERDFADARRVLDDHALVVAVRAEEQDRLRIERQADRRVVFDTPRRRVVDQFDRRRQHARGQYRIHGVRRIIHAIEDRHRRACIARFAQQPHRDLGDRAERPLSPAKERAQIIARHVFHRASARPDHRSIG